MAWVWPICVPTRGCFTCRLPKSQDELFRSKNLIAINWSKMGDLSSLKEMQAIKSKYSQKYSTAKVKTIRGVCEQIYNFVNEISKGDLVVYLSPKSEDVKIGEIVGVYEYNTEISQRYPNQRKVKWLKSVPKKIFSQNALNEISSEKKLCQIKHYAYEYYVNLESKIPVNFNWDVDVAQKLLLHVDNLFHQRINIFLVAEGILFAAFAVMLNCSQYKIVRVLICIAGASSTLLLGYTLSRLFVGLTELARIYKALETSWLYDAYRNVGREGESSNKLMA